MSIIVPDWAAWIFSLICGSRWPEGDEDQMRALAAEWDQVAISLGGAGEGFGGLNSSVTTNIGGTVGKAFFRYGQQLTGFEGNFSDTATGQAAMLRAQATAIEEAKIGMIVQMAWTLGELAWAWWSEPEAVPGIVAESEVVVEELSAQLLRIGREIAETAAREAAVAGIQATIPQLVEIIRGNQAGFDFLSILTQSAMGAAGGVAGHGLQHIGQKATPKLFEKAPVVGAAAVGALTGVGLGVVSLPLGGDPSQLWLAGVSGGLNGAASHLAASHHGGAVESGDGVKEPTFDKPPPISELLSGENRPGEFEAAPPYDGNAAPADLAGPPPDYAAAAAPVAAPSDPGPPARDTAGAGIADTSAATRGLSGDGTAAVASDGLAPVGRGAGSGSGGVAGVSIESVPHPGADRVTGDSVAARGQSGDGSLSVERGGVGADGFGGVSVGSVARPGVAGVGGDSFAGHGLSGDGSVPSGGSVPAERGDVGPGTGGADGVSVGGSRVDGGSADGGSAGAGRPDLTPREAPPVDVPSTSRSDVPAAHDVPGTPVPVGAHPHGRPPALPDTPSEPVRPQDRREFRDAVVQAHERLAELPQRHRQAVENLAAHIVSRHHEPVLNKEADDATRERYFLVHESVTALVAHHYLTHLAATGDHESAHAAASQHASRLAEDLGTQRTGGKVPGGFWGRRGRPAPPAEQGPTASGSGSHDDMADSTASHPADVGPSTRAAGDGLVTETAPPRGVPGDDHGATQVTVRSGQLAHDSTARPEPRAAHGDSGSGLARHASAETMGSHQEVRLDLLRPGVFHSGPARLTRGHLRHIDEAIRGYDRSVGSHTMRREQTQREFTLRRAASKDDLELAATDMAEHESVRTRRVAEFRTRADHLGKVIESARRHLESQDRSRRGDVRMVLDVAIRERELAVRIADVFDIQEPVDRLVQLNRLQDDVLADRPLISTGHLGFDFARETNDLIRQIRFRDNGETELRRVVDDDVHRVANLTEDPHLPETTRDILTELVGHARGGRVTLTAGRPGTSVDGSGDRHYRVEHALGQPEGSFARLGSLVHELTHVSGAEHFDNSAMMILAGRDLGVDELSHLAARRRENIDSLRSLLNEDTHFVSPDQLRLIENALSYGSGNVLGRYVAKYHQAGKISEEDAQKWRTVSEQVPHDALLVEYDTVVNQMLVYMHLAGVSPAHRFHERLLTLGKEALDYRRQFSRSPDTSGAATGGTHALDLGPGESSRGGRIDDTAAATPAPADMHVHEPRSDVSTPGQSADVTPVGSDVAPGADDAVRHPAGNDAVREASHDTLSERPPLTGRSAPAADGEDSVLDSSRVRQARDYMSLRPRQLQVNSEAIARAVVRERAARGNLDPITMARLEERREDVVTLVAESYLRRFEKNSFDQEWGRPGPETPREIAERRADRLLRVLGTRSGSGDSGVRHSELAGDAHATDEFGSRAPSGEDRFRADVENARNQTALRPEWLRGQAEAVAADIVTSRFGGSDDASTVPADQRQAVEALLAHRYVQRYEEHSWAAEHGDHEVAESPEEVARRAAQRHAEELFSASDVRDRASDVHEATSNVAPVETLRPQDDRDFRDRYVAAAEFLGRVAPGIRREAIDLARVIVFADHARVEGHDSETIEREDLVDHHVVNLVAQRYLTHFADHRARLDDPAAQDDAHAAAVALSRELAEHLGTKGPASRRPRGGSSRLWRDVGRDRDTRPGQSGSNVRDDAPATGAPRDGQAEDRGRLTSGQRERTPRTGRAPGGRPHRQRAVSAGAPTRGHHQVSPLAAPYVRPDAHRSTIDLSIGRDSEGELLPRAARILEELFWRDREVPVALGRGSVSSAIPDEDELRRRVTEQRLDRRHPSLRSYFQRPDRSVPYDSATGRFVQKRIDGQAIPVVIHHERDDALEEDYARHVAASLELVHDRFPIDDHLRSASSEHIELGIHFSKYSGNRLQLVEGVDGRVRVVSERDPVAAASESQPWRGMFVEPAKLLLQSDVVGHSSADVSLIHEIGHLVSYHHNRGRFLDVQRTELTDLGKRIAQQVSDYAATNAYEFVAEVFTGVTVGHTYPPDVMHMYGALGGPPPRSEPLSAGTGRVLHPWPLGDRPYQSRRLVSYPAQRWESGAVAAAPEEAHSSTGVHEPVGSAGDVVAQRPDESVPSGLVGGADAATGRPGQARATDAPVPGSSARRRTQDDVAPDVRGVVPPPERAAPGRSRSQRPPEGDRGVRSGGLVSSGDTGGSGRRGDDPAGRGSAPDRSGAGRLGTESGGSRVPGSERDGGVGRADASGARPAGTTSSRDEGRSGRRRADSVGSGLRRSNATRGGTERRGTERGGPERGGPPEDVLNQIADESRAADLDHIRQMLGRGPRQGPSHGGGPVRSGGQGTSHPQPRQATGGHGDRHARTRDIPPAGGVRPRTGTQAIGDRARSGQGSSGAGRRHDPVPVMSTLDISPRVRDYVRRDDSRESQPGPQSWFRQRDEFGELRPDMLIDHTAEWGRHRQFAQAGSVQSRLSDRTLRGLFDRDQRIRDRWPQIRSYLHDAATGNVGGVTEELYLSDRVDGRIRVRIEHDPTDALTDQHVEMIENAIDAIANAFPPEAFDGLTVDVLISKYGGVDLVIDRAGTPREAVPAGFRFAGSARIFYRPNHLVFHPSSAGDRLTGVLTTFGRLAAYQSDPRLVQDLVESTWTDDGARIAASVGGPAAGNPHDFVADVFARIALGEEPLPDVMGMYLALGGPRPYAARGRVGPAAHVPRPARHRAASQDAGRSRFRAPSVEPSAHIAEPGAGEDHEGWATSPEWHALRDAANVVPRSNVRLFPHAGDPSRARVLRSAFDVRRFPYRGVSVTDLTVRVALTAEHGVGDEQLDATFATAHDGIERFVNAPGATPPLPNGDRLHVTVERVGAEDDPHLTVTVGPAGTPMTEHRWAVDSHPVSYAHELGHSALGLPDEYDPARLGGGADGGGAVDDAPAPLHVPGTLMGDHTVAPPHEGLPASGFRGRHMDLIAAYIGDVPGVDELRLYGVTDIVAARAGDVGVAHDAIGLIADRMSGLGGDQRADFASRIAVRLDDGGTGAGRPFGERVHEVTDTVVADMRSELGVPVRTADFWPRNDDEFRHAVETAVGRMAALPETRRADAVLYATRTVSADHEVPSRVADDGAESAAGREVVERIVTLVADRYHQDGADAAADLSRHLAGVLGTGRRQGGVGGSRFSTSSDRSDRWSRSDSSARDMVGAGGAASKWPAVANAVRAYRSRLDAPPEERLTALMELHRSMSEWRDHQARPSTITLYRDRANAKRAVLDELDKLIDIEKSHIDAEMEPEPPPAMTRSVPIAVPGRLRVPQAESPARESPAPSTVSKEGAASTPRRSLAGLADGLHDAPSLPASVRLDVHFTSRGHRGGIGREGIRPGARQGIGDPDTHRPDQEYVYVLSGSHPETTNFVAQDTRNRTSIGVIGSGVPYDRDVNYRRGAYRYPGTARPARDDIDEGAPFSFTLPMTPRTRAAVTTFINRHRPPDQPVTEVDAVRMVERDLFGKFTLHVADQLDAPPADVPPHDSPVAAGSADRPTRFGGHDAVVAPSPSGGSSERLDDGRFEFTVARPDDPSPHEALVLHEVAATVWRRIQGMGDGPSENVVHVAGSTVDVVRLRDHLLDEVAGLARDEGYELSPESRQALAAYVGTRTDESADAPSVTVLPGESRPVIAPGDQSGPSASNHSPADHRATSTGDVPASPSGATLPPLPERSTHTVMPDRSAPHAPDGPSGLAVDHASDRPVPPGPVHGLGSATRSALGRVQGIFTQPDRVRPRPVVGVTTEASINAQTPGAGGFADKYYPDLKKLNPSKDRYNCTQAITAVDDMLDGKLNPARQLPESERIGANVDASHPLRRKNPGGTFTDADSWDDVIRAASRTPESRGYVIVYRADRSAHVMNVINTSRGVVFLDGQSGRLAKLDAKINSVRYFQYQPPTRQAPPAEVGASTVHGGTVVPMPVPVASASGHHGDVDPVYQDWLQAEKHFNGDSQ